MSSTPSISEISQSCRSRAAGAKPDSAVAHHDGRDSVPARWRELKGPRSPGRRSACARRPIPVSRGGRDASTSRSGCLESIVPTADDSAVTDCRRPRCAASAARAVDQSPTANHHGPASSSSSTSSPRASRSVELLRAGIQLVISSRRCDESPGSTHGTPIRRRRQSRRFERSARRRFSRSQCEWHHGDVADPRWLDRADCRRQRSTSWTRRCAMQLAKLGRRARHPAARTFPLPGLA